NWPRGRCGRGLPTRGPPLQELASPQLRPLVEGIRQVYRTGHPWKSDKLEVTVQEHAGETANRLMEFSVIPNRDTNGVVIGAVLYGTDVTDIQGREEQERLERYRLLIEHAHQVALALFSTDG